MSIQKNKANATKSKKKLNGATAAKHVVPMMMVNMDHVTFRGKSVALLWKDKNGSGKNVSNQALKLS